MGKIIKTATFVAFAVSYVSGTANAQSEVEGGNKLVVECSQPISGGACIEYLLGVFDGMMTLQNFTGAHLLCPGPGGVNGGQLVLIFNKWATQHPETLSEQRAYPVAASIIDAFACPKSP